MRSIEHDGFRLIWSGLGKTYELYDVGSDPGELRNIADERPDTVD